MWGWRLVTDVVFITEKLVENFTVLKVPRQWWLAFLVKVKVKCNLVPVHKVYFHSFLNSESHGDKRSSSCPGRFDPLKRTAGTD
jgi:hypothetical protein